MAATALLISLIERYLKEREEPIGAIRATARGTVLISAVLAGLGAVAGWLVADAFADGVLAGALGGGLGAAAGMLIAGFVGSFRMRGAAGVRASTVILVLTRRRLLVFSTSLISSRPSGLAREIPIDAIAGIEVGEARLISPQTVTIETTDGSTMTFETARVERPGEFAEAFHGATGR